MVTLVRPRSMFLRCFMVMAMPATIAGKYMRSRQLSFGRGTVTAINFKSGSQEAKNRNELQSRDTWNCLRRFFLVSWFPDSSGRKISENEGRNEDVYEGDFEKENPSQPHELIVTESRQGPAHPNKNEKDGRDLAEEYC